ncbi:MAG: hypothetical protein AAB271_06995, partial [Nitrospirota bacterium]
MSYTSRLRHVIWIPLLIGLLSIAVLGVPGMAEAQVLDRIEIVETPGVAEIHIVFNARALYLRHTPSEKGDLIRIFLDFPDLDRSRRFARELAASPPSDLVPKFQVTFPDQATNGLSIKFERPVRFRVSQRDIRSSSRIVIAVKLDKPGISVVPPVEVKGPAVPKPPVAKGAGQSFDVPPFTPGMDIERYAADLMDLGRAALTAEEGEKAVLIFNAALNLPPNKQSREAQEMIGVAREGTGDVDKAKAEYEHYLKIYP